jgi:hypothetical protein
MPNQGDKCQQSGIYSGTCSKGHAKEVALSKGDTFPPCGNGGCTGSMSYTLKTPTK